MIVATPPRPPFKPAAPADRGAPLRLAAPAPAGPADMDSDDDSTATANALAPGDVEQGHLHALCEAWSAWCRTRRFYGQPRLPASVLGQLVARSRPVNPNALDIVASAELAALHLAILAQPADALDRQVFELHYLWRVKNVKAAADQCGISRGHWYRLVRDFRTRVHAASLSILQANLDAGRALPHAGDRSA